MRIIRIGSDPDELEFGVDERRMYVEATDDELRMFAGHLYDELMISRLANGILIEKVENTNTKSEF